jgi:hypothetical protein
MHQVMHGRYGQKGKPVFTTSDGSAVSEAGWSQSFKLVAKHLGISSERRMSPHTARLSGARHWSRHGCSEKTVMDLGDWKSVEILRRYVGASGVAQNLVKELEACANNGVEDERPKFKLKKNKKAVSFELEDLAATVRQAMATTVTHGESAAGKSSALGLVGWPEGPTSVGSSSAGEPSEALEKNVVKGVITRPGCSDAKLHVVAVDLGRRSVWRTACGFKYGVSAGDIEVVECCRKYSGPAVACKDCRRKRSGKVE